LKEVCELSKRRYPDKPLYLEVRTWNVRAVRCYEKAGFRIDGASFEQVTGMGPGTFYRMVRV
ncbi:MAG: GNAT family N-acetyltransferase, partial [Faecousia sp.]